MSSNLSPLGCCQQMSIKSVVGSSIFFPSPYLPLLRKSSAAVYVHQGASGCLPGLLLGWYKSLWSKISDASLSLSRRNQTVVIWLLNCWHLGRAVGFSMSSSSGISDACYFWRWNCRRKLVLKTFSQVAKSGSDKLAFVYVCLFIVCCGFAHGVRLIRYRE